MITGKFPNLRLRRSRRYDWSRRLIEENNLSSNDFILPIFLIDGKNKKQKIQSMPGVFRYSLDKMNLVIDKALKKGIPMIALFPYTENKKKNFLGTEAINENNLVCNAIQLIKKKYKNEIGIMCDVALDPYTSHGHDGLLKDGYILNDEMSAETKVAIKNCVRSKLAQISVIDESAIQTNFTVTVQAFITEESISECL